MPPKAEGLFLLLHRHRIYNPREGVWMGWERKRGKLMDLDKLLRNEYDSFPVKIGDLSVLQSTRFMITMDTERKLRGSAHRLVGTLAHSLDQGIIDPRKNINSFRRLRNFATARWSQRAERGPFPPRQYLLGCRCQIRFHPRRYWRGGNGPRSAR